MLASSQRQRPNPWRLIGEGREEKDPKWAIALTKPLHMDSRHVAGELTKGFGSKHCLADEEGSVGLVETMRFLLQGLASRDQSIGMEQWTAACYGWLLLSRCAFNSSFGMLSPITMTASFSTAFFVLLLCAAALCCSLLVLLLCAAPCLCCCLCCCWCCCCCCCCCRCCRRRRRRRCHCCSFDKPSGH